jgi:hypothetical protein
VLGLRASKGGPLLLASATDPPSLSEYVEILAEHRLSAWAWGHYKDVLADLLRILNAKRIMEIGAGRSPLFDRAEIEFSEAEYYNKRCSTLRISSGARRRREGVFRHREHIRNRDRYAGEYG